MTGISNAVATKAPHGCHDRSEPAERVERARMSASSPVCPHHGQWCVCRLLSSVSSVVYRPRDQPCSITLGPGPRNLCSGPRCPALVACARAPVVRETGPRSGLAVVPLAAVLSRPGRQPHSVALRPFARCLPTCAPGMRYADSGPSFYKKPAPLPPPKKRKQNRYSCTLKTA